MSNVDKFFLVQINSVKIENNSNQTKEHISLPVTRWMPKSVIVNLGMFYQVRNGYVA
jgi:hypothetical protein